MVRAQVRLHFLQQFGFELLAPEKPAALERLPFLRIVVAGLTTAPLHSLLKLCPACGGVLLNAVLAQEPIHPQPTRTMAARRQIPTEAAPGIFQQPFLRRE